MKSRVRWALCLALLASFTPAACCQSQFDQFGGSTREQCTNTDIQTFTVTGASWASGVATLTIGTNSIALPTQVVITGINPSGFNGTFNLISQTSTTIRYALQSNPGSYSSGGTLTIHYFQPEKVGNRWWLCDPMGNVFWMNSVGAAGGHGATNVDDLGSSLSSFLTAKYGDDSYHAAVPTLTKLVAWGFNSMGQASDGDLGPTALCPSTNSACPYWPNGMQPIPLPTIAEAAGLSTSSTENLHGYINQPVKDLMYGWDWHYNTHYASLADFFDSRYQTYLDHMLAPSGAAPATPLQYLAFQLEDDTDYFTAVGAGPDFSTSPEGHVAPNGAMITLMTSPVQTFNNSPASLYPNDTVVHMKAQATNPVTGCSITNPCSLRDYLWQEYSTGTEPACVTGGDTGIKALDDCWGADYTTFDSSGTQVTGEALCSGTWNGTQIDCAGTLAHNVVSPSSIMVSVNGVAIGGDCPWYDSVQQSCLALGQYLGTLMSPSGVSPALVAGDRAWYVNGYLSQQSCSCSLVSQLIHVVVVYHMKAGYYSIPSQEAGITSNASNQVVAASPSVDVNATGYDVYASACNYGTCGWANVTGNETLQASNIAFGSSWTEPTTGITTTGGSLPNPPSYVNYSTGALSVTFSSAPPSGASVTVSYVYDGWMWGSGLMDEDGRSGGPDFIPTLSQTTGGPASGQVLYAETTFVTADGESAPSPENSFAVGNGDALVVASPQGGGAATGYNVYVATASGAEKKQNASPVSLGSSWTEPTTGITTTGNAPPASWTGTNLKCLETNAVRNPGGDAYFACDGISESVVNDNANFGKDLDGWLPEMPAQYFKTVGSEWRKYNPYNAYFGADTVGAWYAPPSKEILAGAAPYVDGIFTQFAVDTPVEGQAMYNYISKYLGDKPLTTFSTLCFAQGSSVWIVGPQSDCLDSSQPGRGQHWYNLTNAMLNDLSYNNTYQFVGTNWWGEYDFYSARESNNWGFQTLIDDAYDGICDQPNQIRGQWGYTCGGEEFPYGNALTGIEQANQLWWHLISGPQKAVGGGVAISGGTR